MLRPRTPKSDLFQAHVTHCIEWRFPLRTKSQLTFSLSFLADRATLLTLPIFTQKSPENVLLEDLFTIFYLRD